MERTVPSTASDEVELYTRTYYSLLRSSAEVQIRTLEEVHAGMNSLLHPNARAAAPDMSALIYSALRLPACMPQVRRVVLGQSLDVFRRGELAGLESWQPVAAAARRRRCFFNGEDTLACFIASRSDIDDVIPLMAAYQIEWNKLHDLLQRAPRLDLARLEYKSGGQQELADALQIGLDDLARLRAVWKGPTFAANLSAIAAAPLRLRVKLLSGSLSEYRRATNLWWENIERLFPALKERPVYFVSSNNHCLPNLLTGFALRQRQPMLDYLHQGEGSDLEMLRKEWAEIESGRQRASEENFLYYLLKKYQATPQGHALIEAQRLSEQHCGIERIPSEHSFDLEAQVIDLSKLEAENLDPRLIGDGIFLPDLAPALKASRALLVNIDYPLGLGAYHILSEVADQAGRVAGVYVMGKAASLNGVVGDVMIPGVVHDEHSRNTFMFSNCFEAADVAPYLAYGTVLDNQKAVTVQGTFLQTADYMDVFYREGYTDIEMEAGPYLEAIYEMFRPIRCPTNEIVNLYGAPFDIGLIHYVSDTPLSKGRNLGANSLSYFGMDSTYAASVAILRRIFERLV